MLGFELDFVPGFDAVKHGVIKNLDMPGMTMVFQVKDAAMLDSIKTGDKIKFKAEQAGSAIVVTEIQPAK